MVSKMDFRDFHGIMKPSLRGNFIIIMIILEGLRNRINRLQFIYIEKLSHSASRDFKIRSGVKLFGLHGEAFIVLKGD